jgi:ribosomal protein L11 methyltransferase
VTTRRWLELQVPAHAEAVEAVSEILTRVGHQGIAVDVPVEPRGGTDHTVKAYLIEDGEIVAKVNDVRDALGHLQAFGLGPIGEMIVREIADEDWLESWKAQFTPIRVGRFLVRPTWTQDVRADGAIELVLDPGMAFGTGLHPTTRGCLTLLQRIEPMPDRCFDVGTGSGILGLAALRLGAGRVMGLDTDPIAVTAAKANAAVNGLTDAFEARQGTVTLASSEEPYPLVLANLVANVLIQLAQALAANTSPGGTLIASGIIEPRGDEVLASLRAAGFELIDRLDDAEWISLRMVREG